jgi:hypothetical protein
VSNSDGVSHLGSISRHLSRESFMLTRALFDSSSTESRLQAVPHFVLFVSFAQVPWLNEDKKRRINPDEKAKIQRKSL